MQNSTNTQESPARRAAVAGLAVVGFLALVFMGMILAIYAARFVPETGSGLASASAYLSSVFTPDGETATLTTVPTTTVPFPITEVSTTTLALAPVVLPAETVPTPDPVQAPKPATHTSTVATGPAAGALVPVAPPAPYGLPNLTVAITAVGFIDPYGNFIPSNEVLNSTELAIKFTITNTGTNVAAPWDFSAVIPTKQNAQFTFNSVQQAPLNPGAHVDYTLHLDPGEARTGYGLVTSVIADPQNRLPEITKQDNFVTAPVNVSNHN